MRVYGRAAAFLAALLLLPPALHAQAAPQTVKVIANPSVELNTLETGTLRAIFSMRMRQWPNGDPIEVFVLPDRHPIHLLFTKKILHIFPFVLRDQWDRLTFTGTGRPPTLVDSEDELIEKVRETKGAIGYSSQSDPTVVNLITISQSQRFVTSDLVALEYTFLGDTK